MNDNDDGKRRILTPTGLNRLVADLLGDTFPRVWVEGELSNVARPASGHMYFTLKDAGAQIRCAMFRSRSMHLTFKPQAGDQVLVRARVGLYAARGDYQLVVDHMEQAGEGALRRQFEELKARLDAEGLFKAEHKQPLPRFPRRIGIITSATGAAVRDMLRVLGRRFPLATADVLPVPVQGKESPAAVTAMLQRANRMDRHDVLVVTRGGGSLEDLAGFNDEAVARTIFASRIPVLSAIGHEIDFTIADFVADARAATPSAAAELLVPDQADIRALLDKDRRRMLLLMQGHLNGRAQYLDGLATRLRTQSPTRYLQRQGERLQAVQKDLVRVIRQLLRQHRDQVDRLQRRLVVAGPAQGIPRQIGHVDDLHRRLVLATRQRLGMERAHVTQLGRTLHAVSPLATLERGYAIVLDENDHAVRSVAAVPVDAVVTARLHDGTLRLRRLPDETLDDGEEPPA